jgi:hypothetical protein
MAARMAMITLLVTSQGRDQIAATQCKIDQVVEMMQTMMYGRRV